MHLKQFLIVFSLKKKKKSHLVTLCLSWKKKKIHHMHNYSANNKKIVNTHYQSQHKKPCTTGPSIIFNPLNTEFSYSQDYLFAHAVAT